LIQKVQNISKQFINKKEMGVSSIKKRTFESGADFFIKLFDALKGPTILMTFLKVDSILREKVLLTLSISNNCYT
jgi:hypothetical protein